MDLINFINQIKGIGYKPGFVNYFRGHSDIKFKLVPSIYRNGYIKNEDMIFKETIVRAPHEFSIYKSTIEKLVKMQHYGVPTRLLDITSNPLIALYFACNNNCEKEGEVVFLQIPQEFVRFYDSDTVSILSNIAKRPHNFEFENNSKSPISDFNQLSHIVMLHHEIKDEKPYFKEIINPKDIEQVYAVKVKLDNPRILKQNGAFLLFGIRSNKSIPAEIPFQWILNKTNKKLKMQISKDNKKQILNELDLLGINNSILFPELENQAQYLKNIFGNNNTNLKS